jgi:hypothetical protein
MQQRDVAREPSRVPLWIDLQLIDRPLPALTASVANKRTTNARVTISAPGAPLRSLQGEGRAVGYRPVPAAAGRQARVRDRDDADSGRRG